MGKSHLKIKFYLVQHVMCLRDSARRDARGNQQHGTNVWERQTCSVQQVTIFSIFPQCL